MHKHVSVSGSPPHAQYGDYASGYASDDENASDDDSASLDLPDS